MRDQSLARSRRDRLTPARYRGACVLCLLLATAPDLRAEPAGSADAKPASDDVAAAPAQESDSEQHASILPFWADEARKRGYELPDPFGVGIVYYGLYRQIRVTDVRVAREGSPPASVSKYADFGTTSDVKNLNLKFDTWIFPFLNVYAVVGYVKNESTTRIDVALPPLVPDAPTRQLHVDVPTSLTGKVGGIGMTLAYGYKQFFVAADGNRVVSDLGFDEKFTGSIVSLRAGWAMESQPVRVWLSDTKWNLYTTIKGINVDTESGPLKLEVDQGPKYATTYGLGASWSPRGKPEFLADVGGDLHGGWYLALMSVVRF